MIHSLRVNDVIINDDIQRIFKCSGQGGMRRSKQTNTLVIVTNHVESLYEDRWVGDVLHYTGMGRTGDQSLTFMQNKTLYESNSNGVEVHLFEVFKEQQYTYKGIVKLIEEPYSEYQLDDDNNQRIVWIFPVKLLDENTELPDKEIVEAAEVKGTKRARKMSDEELKERAKTSSGRVGRRNTSTVHYQRDAFVAEYAKRWANGICQLCEQEAPFENINREPYLETHHIEWLAHGGEDTIYNTVALCPNCHKKMHVVDDENDVTVLKDKVMNSVV